MKEIDKLIQGKKWKEICNKVFNRQKGICQKCGIQLRKLSGNTQVDHIIPRRFWDEPEKSNSLDNLRLLCQHCHTKVDHQIRKMEKVLGFELTKKHLFQHKGF